MKRGGYSTVSSSGLRLVEIIQARGRRKTPQMRMSAAWVSRRLNVERRTRNIERRSAGIASPAVGGWTFDVGRSTFIATRYLRLAPISRFVVHPLPRRPEREGGQGHDHQQLDPCHGAGVPHA